MGLEQRCTARFDGEVSPGKASLESQSLTFRGGFKLVIPLGEVDSVTVEGAELRVRFTAGEAIFDLGPAAVRWAERIRQPRSRLDRLGVKPGLRACLLDVPDDTLETELRQRCGALYQTTPREPVDLIFMGLDQRNQLARIGRMRWFLRRGGALWLVRPTGATALTEAEVLSAGRSYGFVDTRVASLAQGLTAHRFVFPLAAR